MKIRDNLLLLLWNVLFSCSVICCYCCEMFCFFCSVIQRRFHFPIKKQFIYVGKKLKFSPDFESALKNYFEVGKTIKIIYTWPHMFVRLSLLEIVNLNQDWVCCFSTLLREAFPWVLRFSPSSKTTFAGVAQLASARLSEQGVPSSILGDLNVCFHFPLICLAKTLNIRESEHWQRERVKGARSASINTSFLTEGTTETCKGLNDLKALRTLYCSLVRSNLEYCSVVWSPYSRKNIDKLEGVQRLAEEGSLAWKNPIHCFIF